MFKHVNLLLNLLLPNNVLFGNRYWSILLGAIEIIYIKNRYHLFINWAKIR